MANTVLSGKRRFLIVLLLSLAGLVGVAVVVDQFVLPAVVHSANVIAVPNLVGRSVESAKSHVIDLGLVFTEPKEQYSEKVVKGQVLSQLPYAGAKVKEGRRIYVTISKGAETLAMPDLRGTTLREARLVLLRSGLDLGDVQYENSDTVPSQHIVGQGIRAGGAVSLGAVCSVVLSKGPSGGPVPDVRSMSIDEASALLLQRGFTLGTVEYRATNAFMANTVVDQMPAPASMLPAGAPINLVVVRP